MASLWVVEEECRSGVTGRRVKWQPRLDLVADSLGGLQDRLYRYGIRVEGDHRRIRRYVRAEVKR